MYPDFNVLQSNWDLYTGKAFLANWLASILNLSEPENKKTAAIIAANFQSCNKIAEVVDRHLAALSPSQLSQLPPILQTLTQKWERENAGLFGSPLEEAALKAKIDGRSYLRLFFQPSYEGEPMEEALEVHCVPISSVRVQRRNGFMQSIEYSYSEDGKRLTERQFLSRGQTVFQILENQQIIKEFSLDLGGGFSIVEINLPPLITASIAQNQNAINFALTLLPHNLAYSGWVQQIIFNAQPPGSWSYDDKGREKFTANPEGLPSGAGVTQFIQGLPLKDERSNLIGYTQPDMRLQQPIDPKTFVETYRAFTIAIYEQSHQSFVLGADLPLSGVSREQSRRDFANLIDSDARRLGYNFSDLLSVANFLLGNKEKVVVNIIPKIDRGIEHKKLVLEARSQGLISLKSAIEQLGFVADVEAELAELAKEKPPASSQDASGETAINQS
jgi:hypothetical protein